MEAVARPSKTTSKLPPQTIERAVNALLKWKSSKSKTQKPQLLSSDEFLYLVITLNKIPPKGRTNAHKIPLPNPLYTPESSEICLFVDDRNSQLAKQKIEKEQIPVSKVIKLSKLKSDYKPFEAKRKLCDSYDLFFADKRVIPLLPKVIGRHFYKNKKIPAPIELGRSNWKEQIERTCSSAMVYLSTGTCSVVKIAKASMEKKEIIENVIASIDGIVEVIPKKWANVRSFHLKFSESLALPIYQKVPEMKMKIDGLMKSDVNGDEQVVVMEKTKEKEREKLGKKKGRIHEVRYMDNLGFGDMVREDDDSGSEKDDEEVVEGENGEVGSDEIVGKKRKKGDLEKKVAKLKKSEKGLKLKKAKGLKKSKILV